MTLLRFTLAAGAAAWPGIILILIYAFSQEKRNTGRLLQFSLIYGVYLFIYNLLLRGQI